MAASTSKAGEIDPSARDIALLRGLFEARVMTAGHIAALYFHGKREYPKKRLQKLKEAGLISERRRRVNEPAILFLTRKGFNLLSARGDLSNYPKLGANSFAARTNVSEFTLNHELEVMDVKAAFHTAARKIETISIVEFCTWPLLNEFRVIPPEQGAAEVSVKPDGFCRIRNVSDKGEEEMYDCFLEVDRSSETLERLVGRTLCYREHYVSGGFAVRNGGKVEDIKEYPFRVLIVVKSFERRNNMAAALIRGTPPILQMAWLTTQSEVVTDPFGAIWVRPREYREVTDGTVHDISRDFRSLPYRRQSERDAFIESKIKKRSFWEE